MCGIAGFVERKVARSRAELLAIGQGMADRLAHRGPDGSGVWADEQAGVCLAHRRLAVLDLTPTGAQPMESACGGFVVSYNGEIFNHDELRAELQAAGASFRGRSDTEVLVEACARWGAAATARKLVGMFAFALWDKRARALWLVRDRMGVKPLYWRWHRGCFSFGSELKALGRHPAWSAELDRDALTAYVRFGMVPAPRSIWQGVSKLPPGAVLHLAEAAEPRLFQYWDLLDEQETARTLHVSDAEATDRLEALLLDAVGRRMEADVPLGAFLSGGIDSSVVVAMMKARASGPVHTFSIGFSEAAYDETPHARAVARHLGTEHTELIVEPGHALEIIPNLPHWYDEPFADASQIPTCLVSALARRHVTVALSGDGGDELFAGYTRHRVAARHWGRLAKVPLPLRRAASALLAGLPPSTWDKAFGLLPSGLRPSHGGERLHKLAAAMAAPGPDGFYRSLLSQWPDPSRVVRGGAEPATFVDDPRLAQLAPDLSERMQLADMGLYLPDDILVKLDRASMAVALEARTPLLDHRLVRFALTLPPHQRIRDGKGKWLLRQVLYRHVPRELVERPKMGFGVPVGDWLRGPLREWAEELLDERRLREDGLFRPAPVRRLWADHLAGTVNGQYALWTVLMANAWLDAQG